MLIHLFQSGIPNKALASAGFVLAHCAAIADSNRDGELICPFAVLEGDDGRQVIDFESDTQEEAVSKGWASLVEAQSRKIPWTFGREGISRTPDGKRTDVLTVTVWMPGMRSHYSVSQRFSRKDDQAIHLIGEPGLLKHGDEFAEPVERWNAKALLDGVARHPKGAMWKAWRSTSVEPG